MRPSVEGTEGRQGISYSNEGNAIRVVLDVLRGDAAETLDREVDQNLRDCAAMAVHYAARMGLTSQDAVDALAAIFLVIGKTRVEFFKNVFVKRMIDNPRLSPRLKLNRLVEIVIGNVPRPDEFGAEAQPCINDNPARKIG